jgi:dynein heavy chain, axonemal
VWQQRAHGLLQVRDKEANIDNLINPIEDMYALLTRYEVAVPKEESDLVSDLHYSWKKLRKLATDVSNRLAKLQAGFKRELIKQVNVFKVEAKTFR